MAPRFKKILCIPQTTYICNNRLSSFRSQKTYPWSESITTFSTLGCRNSSQVKEHGFPFAHLPAFRISEIQKACSRTFQARRHGFASKLLPRPLPSPRKADEHLLGLGSGLLWGFPSFIVAVRPGAWEGPPRKGWSQDWEKGCIREARDTRSREGWEAGWEGSWGTRGKLSAKLIYVFGFLGAFNSHPCFSWLLLSWVREGWLNIAMPQKKNFFLMKNPFAFSPILFTFERHV